MINNDFLTKFSQRIFNHLNDNENIFISPQNIMTAMSLVLFGAKRETRKILSEFLGIDDNSKIEEFQKSILNDEVFQSLAAAWFRDNLVFENSYLDFLKRIECKSETLDFSDQKSKDLINEWVEKATNGNIKDLIKSTNENTALVLTSVCNFIGKWNHAFDKKKTKNSKFELSNGKTIETPMMNMKEEFLYAETDEYQMISLYYQSGYYMRIYLPKESKNSFDLEELDNHFAKKAEETKVDLSLPKFKMSKEYDLKEKFAEMGLGNIFSNKADFSGISKDLFVSDIVHKTFVECEEKGTVASAATGVSMALRCCVRMPKEVVFKADHPFIFTINKNNQILFLGKVENPND
ncbi:MAG: serpin family protein [Neisseriaceae bacterium]|nr:MAG: serpin family protein [Neisseriaceae bacterium]